MSLSSHHQTDICHRSGYLPSDRTGPVLYDSGRHHRHSQRPRHPQVQLQNGPQPPLFHPPGPDHSSPDLRPLWLWHLDPGHLPSTLRPSGLPFQLGGWHRPSTVLVTHLLLEQDISLIFGK